MKQLLRVPGIIPCLSNLASFTSSTSYPLSPLLRPFLLSVVTSGLRKGDMSVTLASSDTSMEGDEGIGGAVRYGEMLVGILQEVNLEKELADEIAV